MRLPRLVVPRALCWLGSVASCTGQIDAGPTFDHHREDSSDGSGGAAGGPGSGGDSTTDELPWPASFDGQPSVLRRLSRDEITTTMQVLVGAAPARDDLPSDRRDTAHAQHTNTGAALIAQEFEKLALAIDGVSGQAGASSLARSGCKATGQAQRDCLGAYAVGLAEKAFRRRLSDAESVRIKGIFAGAGASQQDDLEAVTQMVRAIFLSASFVYRGESGDIAKDRPNVRVLNAAGIAVRLAFLATLSPPDEPLLKSAASGALLDPDERLAQLNRLLATAQGTDAMAAFVLEHLGASESHTAEKSEKYRQGLPSDYDTAARASAMAAIRAAVSDAKRPSLATVLTSTTWLNDPALAAVRQPTGTGAPDAGKQRVGLLMHPYVLASHTKDNGVSPFQMGIFIREALLCDKVPAAPANAVMMARSDPPAGMSIRQELEYRTNASPVCTSCHATFAPFGYAFLPFDPVGRWVAQDPTGKPWDATGEVDLSYGEPLSFNDAGELLKRLADHPQVHGCFAQAAVTWAFGRRPVPADQALLASMSEASMRTSGAVPELFRVLVTSPDFVNAVVAR